MSYSLRKKILAAAAAGAVIMSFPMMSGCQQETGGENSGGNTSQTTSQSKNDTPAVSKFGDNTAAKSKNYKISLPIMQYLFNYNYQRYINNYAMYLSYIGLDTNLSLKEQYRDEDNKETWYDYFLSMTRQYVEQTVVLGEAAKEEGFEVTADETSSINSSFESLSSMAAEESKTVEDYINKYYGSGVTQDDIKDIMEVTMVAQDYYEKLYNSYEYTDEQYEKYYSENKTSYLYADFLSFTFMFADTASSDSSETSIDEKKKEEAKKQADELLSCETQEEFMEYVKQYLKDNPDLVNITAESSESSITEEEFNSAVESQSQYALSSKSPYETSSAIGKWVFADDRKDGDSTIIENNNSYSVVIIVKAPYRDEEIRRNVRHILIKSDTEGSDEKARKKADEIYKEWQDGESTEDSFSELAKKYSQDSGSASTGGIYKDVYRGQMVSQFNDWLFDEERKTGDTGIVKTAYGYHIMYYVGENGAAWKTAVDSMLRKASFDEEYKKLQEKYPVDFDEDYIKLIEIIDVPENETSTDTSADNSADTSVADNSSSDSSNNSEISAAG